MFEYLKLNFRAFWLFTVLKIKKILTFRTNLIFQTGGMMLNNIAFFGIWYLLLLRFGDINGYSFNEFLLIQGFIAFIYSIFYFFFSGINLLGEYINEDKIVDLQFYPISPLTILITKGGNASQLGDFIIGFAFLAYIRFKILPAFYI